MSFQATMLSRSARIQIAFKRDVLPHALPFAGHAHYMVVQTHCRHGEPCYNIRNAHPFGRRSQSGPCHLPRGDVACRLQGSHSCLRCTASGAMPCAVQQRCLRHSQAETLLDRLTDWVAPSFAQIAHSWTGNLVSCASWEHFWLNEGENCRAHACC